jgi:hypothetical protein
MWSNVGNHWLYSLEENPTNFLTKGDQPLEGIISNLTDIRLINPKNALCTPMMVVITAETC